MLALTVTLLLAGILGWHYLGYPIVLWVTVAFIGSDPAMKVDDDPPVSIVIIARNEENAISERVENCLAVDYPTEKIEVIVASDGSTDRTVARAREVDGPVSVFDHSTGSKSETRNMAIERATNEIILFTDADTRYCQDCIRQHVDRYADPEVGAVSGVLVTESFDKGAIGEGKRFYWRWEYFMRDRQGRLGTLIKMSGANMSMRKSYYRPVPDTMDIDQFAGLQVIRSGGKAVHATAAIAKERFDTDPENELSVRRRLTIRSLSAISYHRTVFNPFSHPFLSVHVTSYWLIRYMVPFLLVALAFTSVLALERTYMVAPLVAAQGIFYGAALIGYISLVLRERMPFSLAFSFCWANLGVSLGVLSYLSGTRLTSY